MAANLFGLFLVVLNALVMVALLAALAWCLRRSVAEPAGPRGAVPHEKELH